MFLHVRKATNMYRLLRFHGIYHTELSRISERYPFSRSLAKVTNYLPAIERQEYLQDTNNDVICSATLAQPQPEHSMDTQIIHSSSANTLDCDNAAATAEILDVPKVRVTPDLTMEKTALPFEEIPGPAILKLWEKYWKYVPLLGRLNWNRNITPLQYLFNEYGPIVRIHGPIAGNIVMIHRPEHIAEVFKQEEDSPIRSGIDILQHYHLHYRKYRLPGPFSMQGAEWTDVKVKLEKPFTQQLSQYFDRLELTSDELVQRIRKIRNRQDEVPGQFIEELTRWSMECFSILMFNRRLGFLESTGLNVASEPARIIEALTTAHVYLSRCETGFQVWRFFETPFAKKLFGACDVIDSVIGKYIRQAQNKVRHRTLTPLDDKDTMAEESSPILEKILFNERIHPDDITTLLMDMIVLGVQATSNCQGFLLYYLAKNPRVQRKLFEEIYPILPNRSSTLNEATLKSLPYLKACLQECLRLRPAFPYITRVLPKTINLHGYTIPKGTYLIMANQIAARREENFEDPEKFKPERWMTNNDNPEYNQEFSYLPFGHGVRSCLGKSMAKMEMMLLTAKLIREYRIEYDYADIGSRYMMVNVPNRPLRFRFVDRD
ncbi:probable cytochrome P450 12a5, mitochondrial isoform X2 [Cephus cinctus]|uniref:Probable cytochrome P450 12a5, mitochondrial isoform X2 n=1 Tax=Cephus cinctus TaxID=211228 RepID=A0AAJ7RRE4_CEPCN|nr:probable cytochrome P450 12a5, mitochondrial isoform X2 [Cephus cinctus]